MSKLIRILEFIVNLLPWLVPLVVGLLAWLQSISWYIIAISTIGAFGLAFWGKNQYDIFRERWKKGIAELNEKQIEKTIRDWLDQPIYKVQRKDDPNCFFKFIVTDEQGRPVTISRTRSKPTQLFLATAITLSDEHRKNTRNLIVIKRKGCYPTYVLRWLAIE